MLFTKPLVLSRVMSNDDNGSVPEAAKETDLCRRLFLSSNVRESTLVLITQTMLSFSISVDIENAKMSWHRSISFAATAPPPVGNWCTMPRTRWQYGQGICLWLGRLGEFTVAFSISCTYNKAVESWPNKLLSVSSQWVHLAKSPMYTFKSLSIFWYAHLMVSGAFGIYHRFFFLGISFLGRPNILISSSAPVKLICYSSWQKNPNRVLNPSPFDL